MGSETRLVVVDRNGKLHSVTSFVQSVIGKEALAYPHILADTPEKFTKFCKANHISGVSLCEITKLAGVTEIALSKKW